WSRIADSLQQCFDKDKPLQKVDQWVRLIEARERKHVEFEQVYWETVQTLNTSPGKAYDILSGCIKEINVEEKPALPETIKRLTTVDKLFAAIFITKRKDRWKQSANDETWQMYVALWNSLLFDDKRIDQEWVTFFQRDWGFVQ